MNDNRGPREQRGSHAFYGPLAAAYEFCGDTMRSTTQIATFLKDRFGGELPPDDEVRAAMAEFCRRGLAVAEDDKYFSLALPVNPNW